MNGTSLCIRSSANHATKAEMASALWPVLKLIEDYYGDAVIGWYRPGKKKARKFLSFLSAVQLENVLYHHIADYSREPILDAGYYIYVFLVLERSKFKIAFPMLVSGNWGSLTDVFDKPNQIRFSTQDDCPELIESIKQQLISSFNPEFVEIVPEFIP